VRCLGILLGIAAVLALHVPAAGAQQTYISEEFGFRVTAPKGWLVWPSQVPNVQFSGGRDLGDRFVTLSIGAEVSQWSGLLATQEEVNAWWGGPQAAFHLLRLAQVAEDAANEAFVKGLGSSLTTSHPARTVAQGLDSIGGATARAALIEKSFSVDNVLTYACIWAGQMMTVQNEVVVVAVEYRRAAFCTARHVMHPELVTVVRSIVLE